MFPGTYAASAPNRPAAVMAGSGKTMTYRQLDDNSARLASALHILGLHPGDVIALVSDNSPEVFEVYWAALRSGLYITAVNWHLAPEEAAYILRDSGAQVVIVSAGVRAVVESLPSLVPEIQHWYAFGGHVAGYQSYSQLSAIAGPRLANQPRGSEMLYSSGTTGRPRGIKPRLVPDRSMNRAIRWSPSSRTRSRSPRTTSICRRRRFITPRH